MRTRKVAEKQEKRIAKSISENVENARVQKASGSMYHKKSDVISSRFQIEAKTKAKPSKSITLKKEYFEKIYLEALETGKTPVLVFSFGDSKDYYVLEEHDFFVMAGGKDHE